MPIAAGDSWEHLAMSIFMIFDIVLYVEKCRNLNALLKLPAI